MPHHIKWQIALAGVGIVAIGLLLSLFANRTFVDQPARGGRLVEGVVGAPVSLNPLFAASDVENDICRLVFAGLTKPDPQGRVAPDLATRWEVDEAGTTYRFFLRHDALWHDGQPVTADDVVFTAALAADPRLQPSLGATARQWANTEARKVDEYTVELKLPEPYAPFLAATTLGIVPRHIFADVPVGEIAQHRGSTLEPVGAGPFKLQTPGGTTEDAIHLVRFDDHWNATENRPFVDGVTFEFFSSQDAAEEALAQQKVQTLGGLTGKTVEEMSSGVASYSSGQAGYTLVYLNLQRVLFRDAAVRRALSIAVDRDAIVGDPDLLSGQGIPAASPIPRGSWAYDPEVSPPTYDPARARQILESAGWIDSDANGIRDREGKSLALTIGVGDDPLAQRIAAEILTQWTDIGVDVKVQPMDQQRVIQELTEHTYDAMLFSWVLHSYDPDPFPLWHSSQVKSGQNFSGWSDTEVDSWLVEARQATDLDRRRELYANFQRRFAREQPALVLYQPLYSYGVLDGVVGGVQLPQLVVEPSDRYLTLRDWYMETERVFLGGQGSQE